MQCLTPHGLCIIEYSTGLSPSKVNATDPFGAKLSAFPELVQQWGDGRFLIADMFRGVSKRNRQSMTYIVITHASDPAG